MDAIQQIIQDVNALTSGNEIYATYQSQWQYLLESYIGGEEYRRAQHLTRYQLETDAEYVARLKTTPLDNHCQSVISVYNSFLFRKDPDREFGALEMNPELKDFLRDADMDGRNLNAFMKDVSTWASVFGHCWIIIAKPNVGAQTLADEMAQGVRPYVSLLTPLTVLDWSWTRDRSGRYVLSYLRYLEDVNGNVSTVKEWTPTTVRTIVVNTDDQVINEDIIEPNQLGKIPAVCAYNGRSMVRGIGVSDIADIADAQRFIYNATSEIDQSIRLDSHPSLVKTPETQAGIGAGSLIHMPENLDPGLKPYILEFSGASVDKILASIKHTIESIDKMANTGAVRATESRTMSGVAMQTEFQLLNARLSEKADNLELAEEQMWKIWAEYQGTVWEGKVEYPGSFNIRDTQTEIDNLVKAKSAATDPRVIAVIDHEIVEFLGEDGDIIMPETVQLSNGETVPFDSAEPFDEPEEMFNPVTGDVAWAVNFADKRALMVAGWVEK